MKNRPSIGAWLRVERIALAIARPFARLAEWARAKADALLPAFAIIVMLGGLMAANYAVSHTVVVAGR